MVLAKKDVQCADGISVSDVYGIIMEVYSKHASGARN